MDLKSRIAAGGAILLTFLKEPYEKAVATWVVPEWLLNLSALAALAILVMLLLPNRSKS